jgi:hypothetical protein
MLRRKPPVHRENGMEKNEGPARSLADMDMSGPEFFYCERYRIRMLKVRCVQMREKDARFSTGYGVACRDCAQGKEIMEEIKNGDKKCRKCGESKPLDQFSKNTACKDGHENICKACKSLQAKERSKKKKVEAAAKPDINAPVLPANGNRAEQLAEAHWAYVDQVLSGYRGDKTELVGFYVKAAFINGYTLGAAEGR